MTMATDLPPQQVIINNTNQSGGSNAGIVNNFGSQPRVLNPEQARTLVAALSKLPPTKVYLKYPTADPEVERYGRQLADIMNAAKINVEVTESRMYVSNLPVADLHIAVVDPKRAPVFAEVFQKTLVKMGFICNGVVLTPKPSDGENIVLIIVGPISSK